MKTMKLWRNILVMCAAMLSLASCSSDDDTGAYEAAELGGTWQKVYDEGVADAGTLRLGSRRHHRLSYLHRHQCWASADFSQAR